MEGGGYKKKEKETKKHWSQKQTTQCHFLEQGQAKETVHRQKF